MKDSPADVLNMDIENPNDEQQEVKKVVAITDEDMSIIDDLALDINSWVDLREGA